MKFLSPVFSVARGSIGGITYTANQFHALIARARVAPVNPSTTYQSQIRSAFADAEELWEGLTDAQRTAWDDYASTLTYSGPVGTYTVPGRQVFIGNIGTATYLEARLGNIGSIALTAPTIPGFLEMDVVAAVPPVTAGTGVSVDVTYNGAENVYAYGSRSIAYNPSRLRFKGPFSSATLDDDAITSPGDGNIEWLGLTLGLAYFMQVRAITQQAPFRMSAASIVRMLAVTVV